MLVTCFLFGGCVAEMKSTVLKVDQSCVFSRLSSTVAIFCLNGPTKSLLKQKPLLAGGFKHVLLSPLFGEASHFD